MKRSRMKMSFLMLLSVMGTVGEVGNQCKVTRQHNQTTYNVSRDPSDTTYSWDDNVRDMAVRSVVFDKELLTSIFELKWVKLVTSAKSPGSTTRPRTSPKSPVIIATQTTVGMIRYRPESGSGAPWSKRLKDINSTGKGTMRFQFYVEMDILLGAQHDIVFPVVGTSEEGLEVRRPEALGCVARITGLLGDVRGLVVLPGDFALVTNFTHCRGQRKVFTTLGIYNNEYAFYVMALKRFI
ncbi:hypothetical protein NHX12_017217 [Muraenolepis orangiensis]|uniref:Uncharacterized protein n=1 Tax=Muraenolepis orangiensis TaxID=630683 RepID=A0A9Q0DAK3_9TELE|nr:hypothetical protein NHX12_017217 [Muraenolepis orangiensis]